MTGKRGLSIINSWLSVLSGLTIALSSGYLFLRASEDANDTAINHSASHTHWYSLRPSSPLLAPGIINSVISCVAALVMVSSTLSMQRSGMVLPSIVEFSLGVAVILIGVGTTLFRNRQPRFRRRNSAPWVQQWLPRASSLAMLAAGLAIMATALPGTSMSLHLASLTGNQIPSLAAIVGLGLFLGIRHSTDPDHVVAVSTIVARERSVKQGAMIGMMWGFGHTLTIFVVGAAIILLKLTVPPRLGLSMEMTVAFMLILLGVLNLTGLLQRLTQRLTPAARHRADGMVRESANQEQAWHQHAFRAASDVVARHGYYQLLRPLAIGLVHGLAGSAAVALLVLSMIPSPAWAVMYLVIFGLGTVAGMMLMTTVMAIPIALSGRGSARYLTVASGLVSICFGLFLVYRIGFVDGLFTRHVQWTPS